MLYPHRRKTGKITYGSFVDKSWIAKDKPTDKHFYITDKGQEEFTKLGIDLSQIKSEKL